MQGLLTVKYMMKEKKDIINGRSYNTGWFIQLHLLIYYITNLPHTLRVSGSTLTYLLVNNHILYFLSLIIS